MWFRVFKNHNLDIEVVKEFSTDNEKVNSKLFKYIKNIDINKITPLEAFSHLVKIKEIVANEEIR